MPQVVVTIIAAGKHALDNAYIFDITITQPSHVGEPQLRHRVEPTPMNALMIEPKLRAFGLVMALADLLTAGVTRPPRLCGLAT